MDQLFAEPDPPPPPGTPLAARMRPRTLDEVVGQRTALAEGTPLRRAIEQGRPHSMLLHGPPGSGKTTLARIIARASGAALEELSAVAAGRPEVRAVIERAEHRRRTTGEPTVLFLDEIHRFNKAQQDALLPAVEEGVLTLIGATTENPRFEVNAALLSRLRTYELEALDEEAVSLLLRRAVERGELGAVAVDDDALALLAHRSAGDARVGLAALELAAAGARGGRIAREDAHAALDRASVRYDRAGDVHYDVISAWIKATRGSDPDASLYYLAVMLEGGEDPRFIVRRMIILASEDVGTADPQALALAVATAHAVEHVGMPEAQHALAQCAVHLALAPKSNAAHRAIAAAREHVRQHGAAPPPPHLRSPARGYDYPHDHPGGVSAQELMPEGLEGVRFLEPTERDAALAERLAAIRGARGR